MNYSRESLISDAIRGTRISLVRSDLHARPPEVLLTCVEGVMARVRFEGFGDESVVELFSCSAPHRLWWLGDIEVLLGATTVGRYVAFAKGTALAAAVAFLDTHQSEIGQRFAPEFEEETVRQLRSIVKEREAAQRAFWAKQDKLEND